MKLSTHDKPQTPNPKPVTPTGGLSSKITTFLGLSAPKVDTDTTFFGDKTEILVMQSQVALQASSWLGGRTVKPQIKSHQIDTAISNLI